MWHFRAREPGETIREPIQAEFFATESISEPGMALIREGIQNSLDASLAGEKVLVRICLSGPEKELGLSNAKRYFEGAWQHLHAPKNGLQPDQLPSADDLCPFLVFEDFGTCGLEGDPAQAFQPPDGSQNHFYHFFRAEGQSDKGSSERGIWGVGKHVFLRSSLISTIFGLTVCGENRDKLLMGKTVLKSHYLDKGQSGYYQDGYFGRKNENNALVLPLEEEEVVKQFSRDFDLHRGDEPGLSIVVPWPDPEINEKAIVKAVLKQYFYPILTGQLDVVVETTDFEEILEADNLIEITDNFGGDISDEMSPLIKLAKWARQLEDDERVTLQMPYPHRGWRWSEDLFPDGVMESLREHYVNSDRIAFRIPVTVRKKDDQSPDQATYFDVYLQRDPSEQAGQPIFVREGIIISNVHAPRSRAVRAIVVAEDQPIASFLRDAENPAHTEWQHDGTNFRGKYKAGAGDLHFVKRSVYEIVRAIISVDDKEDRTILADFFSIPKEDEEQEESNTPHNKPSEPHGREEEPQPAPPPPRPRGFRIGRVEGGFSVVPSSDESQIPRRLDIRVAYSVRRGSPIRRYDRSDFELDKEPIQVESEGLSIDECSENRVLITIKNKNFGLHITGFDIKRDLYVRAVKVTHSNEEEDNGGTQA